MRIFNERFERKIIEKTDDEVFENYKRFTENLYKSGFVFSNSGGIELWVKNPNVPRFY